LAHVAKSLAHQFQTTANLIKKANVLLKNKPQLC
jgi:hypothetical protein